MENICTKSTDVQKNIELSIASGKIAEGEKLYSLSEICSLFSVGKTTAMKIVKQMEDENVIYKKRGLGYFVKPFAQINLVNKYSKLIKEQLQQIKEEADLLGIDLIEEIRNV